MGSEGLLTTEVSKALALCKNIIGPQRIVEKYKDEKNVFTAYKPEDIKVIADSLNGDTIVLMGGDTGFYSGAVKAAEALSGYDTVIIPGISSVSYFSSRLKMPWQDWKLLSTHGADRNVIGWINKIPKVFAILNDGGDINKLCDKLILYKMDNVRLYVGENLSYDSERIVCGSPKELKDMVYGRLAVMLAVNNEAKTQFWQLKDEEFIRGKVPMTKTEIRTLSLAKLCLDKNSVLYDIGAGTGSVGISAALINPDIKVYAIDRNPKAVQLVEKNKVKFRADNVKIVFGEAECAMGNLESCTHAFIGGSGGNLEQIINIIFEKNADARIVINAVTVDSLVEIHNIIEKYSLQSEIIMASISVGESVGKHTIMKANNPVYVITIGRG